MKSRQILALALCLALCCPCAIAAEEATVPFWRSTGKRVEMRLDWPESAFFQPAGTYDHGLARMSLAMSLAAFGGRPDAPSAMIADFFAALDFSAPQVAQYDTAGADTIGTAIAQSFSIPFAETCGDIVGDELERFGVHLWLAPALNIHRNLLCGRNFEYYSEDPLVSGLTAAAVASVLDAAISADRRTSSGRSGA